MKKRKRNILTFNTHGAAQQAASTHGGKVEPYGNAYRVRLSGGNLLEGGRIATGERTDDPTQPQDREQ